MKLYDVYNPTPAARVIYDGIKNQKPIRIAPGETLSGVLLADHVIETLQASAALGHNVDLEVTEVSPPASPREEPPAPVEQPKRAPAPIVNTRGGKTKSKGR